MFSKQVVFRNGYFFDKVTGKRLNFSDDKEYTIVSNQEHHFTEVTLEKPLKVKTSEQLLIKIQRQKNIEAFYKLLPSNTLIYFDIKIKGFKHIFKAVLQEDLYIVRKHNHKRSDAVLHPCVVTLEPQDAGIVTVNERITSNSLNDLYKTVYVHYLSNSGNPACNAFLKFYTIHDNRIKYLTQHRLDAIIKM